MCFCAEKLSKNYRDKSTTVDLLTKTINRNLLKRKFPPHKNNNNGAFPLSFPNELSFMMRKLLFYN